MLFPNMKFITPVLFDILILYFKTLSTVLFVKKNYIFRENIVRSQDNNNNNNNYYYYYRHCIQLNK